MHRIHGRSNTHSLRSTYIWNSHYVRTYAQCNPRIYTCKPPVSPVGRRQKGGTRFGLQNLTRSLDQARLALKSSASQLILQQEGASEITGPSETCIRTGGLKEYLLFELLFAVVVIVAPSPPLSLAIPLPCSSHPYTSTTCRSLLPRRRAVDSLPVPRYPQKKKTQPIRSIVR